MTGSRVRSAGLSDVGRLRDNNEDRIWIDDERGAYMVVDGLGGHAAGEKAAEIAVETVRARFRRSTGTTEDRIREGITLANNEILDRALGDEALRGMACVLTLAVVEDGVVTVGHVGDSRCYYLEAGTIRKITRDHSPVGEREDSGEISEAEAMRHPRRNEIFRDVGSEHHTPLDNPWIDIVRFPWGPRSAFLLCSDGLSDLLTSEEIRGIAEANAAAPAAAVRALVDAANATGGKDNVSVVLVAGEEYGRAPDAPRAKNGGTAEPAKRSWGAWLPFVLGAAAVLLALVLLRPHIVQTPGGPKLRFGAVREPVRWSVSPPGRIGDVLAQAQPGDTVAVAPGVYRESVTLRDGVAVISLQPGMAIIETQGVGVQASTTQGARLIGFRITGPATTGIRAVDTDVEIMETAVTGALGNGIEIGGEATATVRACRIEGNGGAGIEIRGSAKPLISHNTIVGNGTKQPLRPGILIDEAANPTITGNYIDGNGAEQIWTSPLFDARPVLQANTIAPNSRRPDRLIRVITR